jgi:hypothetical protein
MANINEILARAAALRNETALNSIDPERAGGIMYDTLLALNELWLQQGAALVISKIYASVAAMNADTSPVSDLTGKPIRPGMVVVIASSDSDNGSVYRYNGSDSPSWSLVGKIGNLEPVDSLDSDSTQLPLAARQGKVLDGKISQLGQEIDGVQEYQPLSVELTSGYYYNQANNKVSTTLVEREDTSCARIDVTAGDKFKIYGRGTAVVHLYAFTDSNRNVLLTNTEIVNTRESGLELTAPEGSAYLYINYYSYDSSTDKLQKWVVSDGLVQRVGELDEQLEQGLSDLEAQKIDKTDIVDNLNTNDATKPLSAKQGKVLKTAIQIIDVEINGEQSYVPVTLSLTSDNYYGVNTTLNTVNSSTTSRNGTNCANLDVTAGDKFKIFGKGGALICLYIFADANRNILLRNTELVNSRTNGLEITAPTGATKLYINFLDYDSATDKLEKYIATEGVLQRVLDLEESTENLEQRVDALEESSGGVLKNKVFIAFGDSITEFKWTGAGGDNKGWVDHAEELTGCTIINCAIGGSHMNARYNTELFDASHEYAAGDYVFYKPSDTMNLYRCIAPHTGAWNASNFDDVSSDQSLIGTAAYAPIFVYPMIHAFCNTAVVDKNERFKNQIAAAECVYTWKTSHDDNRAIIQTLMNADAGQIDGVIIAEGTNDYASAWNRGTSGSFDVSTCLGATNQAVLELCSTYKHLALYYVTPPVRWWNWSNGAGNIEDFSDNYRDNGESDITLREWVEILKNEYRLRHIPACDLYNELGWNQWNFANYFPANDGTHPRPGFKNIGAKVASFLIAHNVIK